MPSHASAATARNALPSARQALDVLSQFRTNRPDIIDYRIEEAYRAFRRAVILLERLDTGHDPELAAALARLRTQWHHDMPSETTGG